MKKEEFIQMYGEVAYEKRRQQGREWDMSHSEENKIKAQARHTIHRDEDNARSKEWYKEHCEEVNMRSKIWRENHPDKVITNNRNVWCKGGKYYNAKLQYNSTGLQGERNAIRHRHGKAYLPFKQIIAPKSQLHHQWLPNSAEYTGLALVEAGQHMHGFIDVIQILEGEITLLTEAAIAEQGVQID